MRTCLFGLILLSLAAAGCTHRPVQKDVIVQGPPQHSSGSNNDIQSAQGASHAPIDLQYIDTLIQIHLSAIDAEQLVKTRAGHPELKRYTSSRLSEQQSEIESLRRLRSALFGNVDRALNVELPGARDAMQAVDPEKLDPLKENGFDVMFLGQMISHDEAVIAFSKDLLSSDLHPDLKQVAHKTIDEKTAEIEQMQKWTRDWKKDN